MGTSLFQRGVPFVIFTFFKGLSPFFVNFFLIFSSFYLKPAYHGYKPPMIPFGSFRIGRIFGISIEVNYTWFIIFALVTAALAFAYFPTVYPGLTVGVSLVMGIVTSFLFFASVLIHELMHSLVAIRNGMKVSKITLFIFGGVSQLTDEPQTPAIEFKMAIAGPGTSFVLGIIFGAIAYGFGALGLSPAFFGPFVWLGIINILLGAFNLVPGFPLDGGRVLRSALWAIFKDIRRATKVAARFGQGFAYFLIIVGLVFIFSGLLDGLWLILIGWFLNNAAQGSYQQLMLRETLKGVDVKQIMKKDVETIPAQTRLREAVDEHFLKSQKAVFPVVTAPAGELVGVVRINDVQTIPQDKWEEKEVGQVSKPLPDEKKIEPKEGVVEALTKMSQAKTDNLLVVTDKQLKGKVNRQDIVRLIKIKSRLKV